MLAAIGLAVLSAAPARATDITGTPLTVNVTDRGVTRGYMTNGDIDTFPRQFSTGGGALRFRLADGTTLYDFDARPLTQGPVVRRGAEQTQETTYRLGPFRILETTTLRDGDMGYRAEWAVQNLSGAPVRYRAGAMGNIDGTVVYEAGPQRFVGARDARTGVVRGVEQLPGHPWTGWRHDFEWDLMRWFELAPTLAGGYGRSIGGSFTAALWEEHWKRGLAPGETATYGVRWEMQHGPRLTMNLLGERGVGIVGRERDVEVQALTETGAPIAGAPLRLVDWGAGRAVSSSAVTGADGRASFRVRGEYAGTGHLVPYLDRDGDDRLGPAEPRAEGQMSWFEPFSVTPPLRTYPGLAHLVYAGGADEEGQAIPPETLHWRIEGLHPGEVTAPRLDMRSSETGRDDISVFADLDGDGVRDEGEPQGETSVTWEAPGPGLKLLPEYEAPQAGTSLDIAVSVRDAADEPLPTSELYWTSDGVNDMEDGEYSTDPAGRSFVHVVGYLPGRDTVTVKVDADHDGKYEADEPHASVVIDWQEPPRYFPPADAAVNPVFREEPGDADESGAPSPSTSAGGVTAAAPLPAARRAAPVPRVGRLVRVGARRLEIRLACPAGGAACRGRLTVRLRGRRTVGRYTLRAGQARWIRVRTARKVRSGARVLVGLGSRRPIARRVHRAR